MTIIKRTSNHELILFMQSQIFEGDDIETDDDILWWLAEEDDCPVGFAGLRIEDEDTAFLIRCGLTEEAKGKGLQRAFIEAREREAIRRCLKTLITYTTRWNHRSIANLIRSGFIIYDPVDAYAGRDKVYFQKDIS